MSKKTFIIIATVLVLILLGLVGYYFLIRTNSSAGGSGTSSSGFNFFPFGGNGSSSGSGQVSSSTTATQPTTNSSGNPTEKLRELSSVPVSGAGTMDVNIGTSTKSTEMGTVVRYIEKATGHIYQVDLFSTNDDRISNTTIPLAYDAIWGNGNNSLIARYLETDNQTVDTYSLTLKNISTTTENDISGIAFPSDITDVSVLGTSVFYLQDINDTSVGYVSNFSGSSKKEVWSSPIRDVSGQYVSTKTVALTTKPAQNVPGYLYFVNTSSGTVTKILSDVPGLSTLVSPDASQVLYLAQASDAVMSVYDVASQSFVNTTPTTFPEKCVWSSKDTTIVYCAVPEQTLDGTSLTSWYQGLISFTDDIWKYDTKANTATMVGNLSQLSGGQAIDVEKPLLSDDERYIVFINKIDGSLWSLDLTK